MNKPLPPFYIITGSCVRSQTFTPKYSSTETWVRYSDFVDYYPVALDECAEDKDAMFNENKLLKDKIEKLTKVGNAMSIRTGQFACAKHYQTELKNWADAIQE